MGVASGFFSEKWLRKGVRGELTGVSTLSTGSRFI